MKQVSRSALMPYTCEQMFDVVNDVAAYPAFLPWCSATRIREQTDELMVATLSIERAGVIAAFTTHNRLQRPQRIDLSLRDGPFSSLQGHWLFTALGDEGCKVEMAMRFDFASRTLEFTLGKVFEQAADSMVDAFCERAGKVYG